MENAVGSKMYSLSQWMGRLAYVNLLWIVFTLLGLVIFGISPATAAMFAVTVRWGRGKQETPVFKTFWSAYKKRFFRANFLGLILVVLGYILYFDFNYFITQEGLLYQLLTNLILLFILFYLVILLYIFPVFVSHDLKIVATFKSALMVGYHSPLKTVLILIGLLVLSGLMAFIPPLIIFFLASGLALVLSRVACRTFSQIEDLRHT